MKSILAFESISESLKHEKTTRKLMKKLQKYQELLQSEYKLEVIPKAIVWTNQELATKVFSSIPIPAFTRQDIIYMSPELDVWSKLMIEQLEKKNLPGIRTFYENYSKEHLLVILAHELTHHIDLFVDDFDDVREDSIWFEEGMCFYLPRLHLLDEKAFEQITNIEQVLVKVFESDYGDHSLDDFGIEAYQGSLSSIMFDYWRSYLKVKEIVDHFNGDIQKVFNLYHKWHHSGRIETLTNYFENLVISVQDN